MNLGDKIKKYRVLRGMTQTKLGEMVGFSKTTANSRIRKYETNEMAPKADIRQKIADSLDVDMSSLSDIDIATEEDVMHALFLLEEEYGLEVIRDGNKINLSFNADDNDNQKLMGYLCSWASTKNNVSEDEESKLQYENWKAQFPLDINSYLSEQLDTLETIYVPLTRKMAPKTKRLRDMSEFMMLIRNMMEQGIHIKSEHKSWSAYGDGGIILTFNASQILDNDCKKACESFAQFLCSIDSISDLFLQKVEPNAFITANGTAISYSLRCSLFSGMQKFINEIQKYNDNGINTDWERKNYESYFHLYEDDWKLILFR